MNKRIVDNKNTNETDTSKEISVLLSLKRKELGLSTRAFAKKFGFSPTVLNQIENNKIKTPSMKNLIAIANVLNLSIESVYKYYDITIKEEVINVENPKTILIQALSNYGLSAEDINDVINYIKFKIICRDKVAFDKFIDIAARTQNKKSTFKLSD